MAPPVKPGDGRDPATGSPARQRAHVGLGANLGDPVEQINAVIDALRLLPDSQVVRASSLYRTAPVDADGQPEYVNAIVLLDTALQPLPLLGLLLDLETRFGRVRSFRNAPRTLDLDLLLYGEATLEHPQLSLPHPRMHLRRFVLEPLVEVSPDAVIPGYGSAALLLRGLGAQPVRRIDV